MKAETLDSYYEPNDRCHLSIQSLIHYSDLSIDHVSSWENRARVPFALQIINDSDG